MNWAGLEQSHPRRRALSGIGRRERRALRKDPGLQGKLVLELTIEPSGVVSNIRVISSEMNDKALVAKLVRRIQMFNFGQRAVSRTKINYPVHFLPT